MVTAVAFLFWFLFRFHNLLLMLFAAIIISTATQPLVKWLNQRGISRASASIAIYGLLFLLIGLFIWLGSPLIVDQTATLGSIFADGYQTVRQAMSGSSNVIVRRLAASMPAQLSLEAAAPSESEDVVAALTQLNNIVSVGFRSLLGTMATFLLAFYWTLESDRIKLALLLFFSQEKREIVRNLITNVEEKLSSYILGQGILIVAVGILALIAYLIIGLPHAFILAIFAGLMEAVPLLGPTLGAVPAALLALSLSPLHMLWVVLATVVIQQLENNFLVPRVMNQTVGVRPLVTLLAMYAFGSLFGLVGVLISIPLAAILQLLLDHFVLQRPLDIEETGRDKISVLRYQVQDLVQDIRGQVRHKRRVATAMTDQIEDSIETIALDLDSFLAKTKGSEEKQP